MATKNDYNDLGYLDDVQYKVYKINYAISQYLHNWKD